MFSLKKVDFVLFEELAITDDEKPQLLFSLQIKRDHSVRVVVKNVFLAGKKLDHIIPGQKICQYSDVENILAFVQQYAEIQPQTNDVIEECIQTLSSVIDEPDKSDVIWKKLPS